MKKKYIKKHPKKFINRSGFFFLVLNVYRNYFNRLGLFIIIILYGGSFLVYLLSVLYYTYSYVLQYVRYPYIYIYLCTYTHIVVGVRERKQTTGEPPIVPEKTYTYT